MSDESADIYKVEKVETAEKATDVSTETVKADDKSAGATVGNSPETEASPAGATQEGSVSVSEWDRANERAAEEEARQVQINADVSEAREEAREEFNDSDRGGVSASNKEAESVARMPSLEAHAYLKARTREDPYRGPAEDDELRGNVGRPDLVGNELYDQD